MNDEEAIESGGRIYNLVHEFKRKWEADPFEEPDVDHFLVRASEEGPEGREEFRNAIQVYLHFFAPTPNYTEAQMDANMKRVRDIVESHGDRLKSLFEEMREEDDGDVGGDSGSPA